LDTHEAGRFGETMEYDTPLERGLLHRANCPLLKQDFYELKAQNDYVNVRGFLTWQAGVAQGFSLWCPECFPTDYDGFAGWLRLFFQVGPMDVLESTVMPLVLWFPLLIILQLVYYVYKKESVWNEFGKY